MGERPASDEIRRLREEAASLLGFESEGETQR
jgi:hypothetical protein